MEPKLPIAAIFIAAIDLCREHASYALRIIAPWFLILAIGPCLLVGLNGVDSLEAVSGASFWETGFFILTMVGWGSIAVLWHWRILRDDSFSQTFVAFDKRVWRYILKFVLISIIIACLAALFIALISLGPISFLTSALSGLSFLVLFIGMAVGAIFSALLAGAKLSVALPAVALNNPGFGFSRAWKATEGHGPRLVIITFLPFLPIALMLMEIRLNDAPFFSFALWSAPFALKHLLFKSVEFAFGLLGLTVLSLVYAFFAESKAARHAPQS